MPSHIAPLLAALPDARQSEIVTECLRHDKLRIERIVSHGQVSPPGFWYDQDEHEWVLLLAGSAELELASGQRVRLGAGDAYQLPAHTRHRVSFTSQPAVWLAVFYR